MNPYMQALASLGLFALAACSTPAVHEARQPVDPVVDMLHRGILDLEENVDELNERIAELQQLPPVPDPKIQELRALDLSGWRLHQKQWLVQRERLLFTVHQIELSHAQPSRRPDLWAEWTARQEQFRATFEDLRAQRHALERKRSAVESELLERYFK